MKSSRNLLTDMKRFVRKQWVLLSASVILVISVPLVVWLAIPHRPANNALIYLQGDPRWAKDRVGGSGETIHAVGCTLCCLSMALAHHDIDMNPSQLNRALKENGGYTSRGLLNWDAVPRITNNRIRVRMYNNPADADIPAALAAGNPVLVKVLRSRNNHWVLIVGRRGTEYLIKDPAGNGKDVEPLSKFGSGILAVRIVEKAG